jgi:hypothetical protein
LVAPIEDLKDVATEEFVVCVDSDCDGVLGAVLEGGAIEVFEGSDSCRVFDVDVSILVDVVEVEVLSVEITTTIVGGVVNDDYAVVGVVLSEDGVKVEFYTKTCVVVVATDEKTHRQFSGDFGEMEFLLETMLFLFEVLLGEGGVGLVEDEVMRGELKVGEAKA